jgi:hypothetical protein
VKTTPPKKTIIKVVRPKDKPRPRGTSEIELFQRSPTGSLKISASQMYQTLLKASVMKVIVQLKQLVSVLLA